MYRTVPSSSAPKRLGEPSTGDRFRTHNMVVPSPPRPPSSTQRSSTGVKLERPDGVRGPQRSKLSRRQTPTSKLEGKMYRILKKKDEREVEVIEILDDVEDDARSQESTQRTSKAGPSQSAFRMSKQVVHAGSSQLTAIEISSSSSECSTTARPSRATGLSKTSSDSVNRLPGSSKSQSLDKGKGRTMDIARNETSQASPSHNSRSTGLSPHRKHISSHRSPSFLTHDGRFRTSQGTPTALASQSKVRISPSKPRSPSLQASASGQDESSPEDLSSLFAKVPNATPSPTKTSPHRMSSVVDRAHQSFDAEAGPSSSARPRVSLPRPESPVRRSTERKSVIPIAPRKSSSSTPIKFPTASSENLQLSLDIKQSPSSRPGRFPPMDPSPTPKVDLLAKRNETAPEPSGRPKRARPQEGAYTVPKMDAKEWPSQRGTFGAKVKRRKTTLDRTDLKPSTHPTAAQIPKASSPVELLVPVRRNSPTVAIGFPNVARGGVSSSLTTLSSGPSPTRPAALDRSSMSTSRGHSSPTKTQSATPQGPSSSSAESSITLTPSRLPILGKMQPALESEISHTEEGEQEPQEPGSPSSETTQQDVLAEFADFQFEPDSPNASMLSLSQKRPRPITSTPSSSRSQATGSEDESFRTPRSHISPTTLSKVSHLLSPHAALSTPSRSASRDNRPSLSPSTPRRPLAVQTIKISPRYISQSLYSANTLKSSGSGSAVKLDADAILAQLAADQETRRVAAVAAKQERMRFLHDLDTQEEEQEEEESVEDLGQALANVPTRPESPVTTRHSERLAQQAVNPLPPPMVERRMPNELDKLIKEAKRNDRRGVSGHHAETILAALDATDTTHEEHNPYPTPMSPEAEGQLDDQSYKKVLENVPEGVVDKELLAVARRDREEDEEMEEVEDRWEGFWEETELARGESQRDSKPLVLEGNGAITRTLMNLAETHDLSTMAVLCTRQVVQALSKEDASAFFDWLLPIVFAGQDAADAADLLICTVLRCRGEIARDFVNSEKAFSLLSALGARQSLIANPWDPRANAYAPISVQISTDRSSACSSLFSMLMDALHCNDRTNDSQPTWDGIDTEMAIRLAVVSTLMAVDPSTSLALSRRLQDLIELCLSSFGAIDGEPSEIASNLCAAVISMPLSKWCEIVALLSRAGPSSRELARWVALEELLGPDHLDLKLGGIIPSLQQITCGVVPILEAVVSKSTQAGRVSNLIYLLSEAIGDISAMIDHAGEERSQDGEEPQACLEDLAGLSEGINRCLNRIPSQLSRSSQENQNRSRLSQLHVNLKIHQDSWKKRWRRQQVENMQGLKHGEGSDKGQLRLDFGAA